MATKVVNGVEYQWNPGQAPNGAWIITANGQLVKRSNGGVMNGREIPNIIYDPAPTATTPAPSAPSSGGGGGGGGGGIPSASSGIPSPTSFATDFLSLFEAQQAAAEKAQRQQEKRAAALLQEALTGARGRVFGRFTERGFDPNDYASQIDAFLNEIRSTVPPGDLSAGQYFAGDLTSQIIDRIVNDQVYGYRGDLNDVLGPGFTSQYFLDQSDDPIIDSILNSGYQEAYDVFDRAAKRGSLASEAYTDAINELLNLKTAKAAELQDIGRGVREGYRGQIQGIADTARNRLDTFQLGDVFNPADYTTQIEGLVSDLSGRLEGDIRRSVGTDPLFDWQSLLNKANARSGVTTSQTEAPDFLAALEARRLREEERRGVGTEGIF